MRLFTAVTALCGLYLPSSLVCAHKTSSRVAPVGDFNPPQVFKNTNLVRNTNLEKGYVRETINVVVENVDKQPQSDYYLPFPSDVFDKVGSLEVRDKKAAEKGRFDVEAVEVDFRSDLRYFVIHFPEALAPKSQITLGISYTLLNSLSPRPATISQIDRQFLKYSFSGYALSSYPTTTQKTKLKFPSSKVPDFTVTSGLKSGSGSDPERQGSTFTYGPYDTSKVAPFPPLLSLSLVYIHNVARRPLCFTLFFSTGSCPPLLPALLPSTLSLSLFLANYPSSPFSHCPSVASSAPLSMTVSLDGDDEHKTFSSEGLEILIVT